MTIKVENEDQSATTIGNLHEKEDEKSPDEAITSKSDNNNQQKNNIVTPSSFFYKIISVISDAVSAMGFNDNNNNNNTIKFLSITYPSRQDSKFLKDFETRPWITYRHSFPPILPPTTTTATTSTETKVTCSSPTYTSDVGWGCMLRSGQMMLANALIYHYLGRDWRVPDVIDESFKTYVKILSWFLDADTCPYSLHRIAIEGKKKFEKEFGVWFGPSTISQVLKILVDEHQETKLTLHVTNDGVIYKSDLEPIWEKHSKEDHQLGNGVMIMIPQRLGLEKLNPVYYSALKACFDIPQCVGIAGGKPNHSLFFVGVESDNLIFLDPHALRENVKIKDLDSYTLEDLSSYRCSNIRFASINSVDPSLVIGFYCKDRTDFEDLCARCENISQGKTPLFTIEDTLPVFEEDIDLVSDEEN